MPDTNFETTRQPETLLGRRYRDGGQPIIALSETQHRERTRFLDACAAGILNFEAVPACALCGETHQPLITRSDAYGVPCDMTCCPGCGFIYATRRMDDPSVALFYSEYYRNLYEAAPSTAFSTARFDEVRVVGGKIAAKMVSYLGLGPGAVVAETGAGAGWNLAPFRDLGLRCIGFDYDERFLELGRIQGIEMYNLNSVDPHSVLPKGADLLLAREVLEHVKDPFDFLSDMNGLIRESGHLYLTVPSLHEIPFGYALGDPLQEFQLAHLSLFDQRTLSAFLSMSGFTPLAQRPDLRLIAKKISEPSRRLVRMPHNAKANMRRLRFSEHVARHFWTPLYNIVFKRRYSGYMKAARLIGMVLSRTRRHAFMDRRLRSGV